MHFDLVVCVTKTEFIFPYHHHLNILHASVEAAQTYIQVYFDKLNFSFKRTHEVVYMYMWHRNRKFKVQYKVVAFAVVDVVIFISHPLSFLLAQRIRTFIITSLMNVTSSLCILVSFNYVTNFAEAKHISFISLLISKAYRMLELRSMERNRT